MLEQILNRQFLVPWKDLGGLHNSVYRLFDKEFADETNAYSTYPAVNIWEKDHKVFVTAEIPGIAPEALDLSVEDQVLTLKGTIDEPKLQEGKRVYRQERTSGNFIRSFKMPYPIDPEKINAEYKQGVLNITLGRLEKDKPKKITIKAVS